MYTSGSLVAGHSPPSSVAVIGAGPAGLVAAARLVASGVEVAVFEKSRGIGGRVATRRTDDGFSFDHGAQYVTARGASFAAFLAEGAAAGTIARWEPVVDPPRARFGSGSTDGAIMGNPPAWFVGTPGMSSLFRSLSAGVTVRHGMTVTRVDPTDRGVWLNATDSERGPRRIGAFDAAIIAIPAPQAMAIAGHLEGVAASLARVVVTPCWALMVAFPDDPLMPAQVFRRPDGPISWVARDDSKPDRSGHAATLVIHASTEWSLDHIEETPEAVSSKLFALLQSTIGATIPRPMHAVAHRWRFAQTAVPLGSLFSEPVVGRVLIGGDWTSGARVEAAWDSGEAMANRLLHG